MNSHPRRRSLEIAFAFVDEVSSFTNYAKIELRKIGGKPAEERELSGKFSLPLGEFSNFPLAVFRSCVGSFGFSVSVG